jgi:predicted phage tail protein
MNKHLEVIGRTLRLIGGKAILQIVLGAALLVLGSYIGGLVHTAGAPQDASGQRMVEYLSLSTWVMAIAGMAGLLAGLYELVFIGKAENHLAAIDAEPAERTRE